MASSADDAATLGVCGGDGERGRQHARPMRAKVAAETALGREGESAEVGRLVRWLASPEASYVTGANVDLNGGSCFA